MCWQPISSLSPNTQAIIQNYMKAHLTIKDGKYLQHFFLISFRIYEGEAKETRNEYEYEHKHKY